MPLTPWSALQRAQLQRQWYIPSSSDDGNVPLHSPSSSPLSSLANYPPQVTQTAAHVVARGLSAAITLMIVTAITCWSLAVLGPITSQIDHVAGPVEVQLSFCPELDLASFQDRSHIDIQNTDAVLKNFFCTVDRSARRILHDPKSGTADLAALQKLWSQGLPYTQLKSGTWPTVSSVDEVHTMMLHRHSKIRDRLHLLSPRLHHAFAGAQASALEALATEHDRAMTAAAVPLTYWIWQVFERLTKRTGQRQGSVQPEWHYSSRLNQLEQINATLKHEMQHLSELVAAPARCLQRLSTLEQSLPRQRTSTTEAGDDAHREALLKALGSILPEKKSLVRRYMLDVVEYHSEGSIQARWRLWLAIWRSVYPPRLFSGPHVMLPP